MNNNYEKLYVINPDIIGEMFREDYKFRDFQHGELTITKHNKIVFTDKFGNAMMSSDPIDFENTPEKIVLKKGE